MPIRKDPISGIYRLDLRAPSGERIRRSTGTKDRQAAQEYHDRLKAELWRQDKLGEEADRTFDEAALRFLKLYANARDYRNKVRHVAYWREQFRNRTVRSLTAGDVMDAAPTHQLRSGRPAVPLAPATINRYVATMGRILSLCSEWGWIRKAPKLTIHEEPETRVRWEPRPVIVRLIKAMTVRWMQELSLFAVATGMRQSEITSLTWAQVDMAKQHAYVTAPGAKSKKARAVPLNADAMEVLRHRRGLHPTLVFTRSSTPDRGAIPIQEVDRRVLGRACTVVGIQDFHFHDFRHTWASWHVQSGTPLLVLKELGGWKKLEMVLKYAHLAPDHLASHANAVTFWSQPDAQKEKPPLEAVSTT